MIGISTWWAAGSVAGEGCQPTPKKDPVMKRRRLAVETLDSRQLLTPLTGTDDGGPLSDRNSL